MFFLSGIINICYNQGNTCSLHLLILTRKRKCEWYTKMLRKYFHGHSGIMKSLDSQYNAVSSIKIVKFYIQFFISKAPVYVQ